MKITVHEEEVLSNVEVLKHLQEIRRNRMQELRVRHSTLGAAKGSSIPENVAAAQNQTITYLERTTASEQNTESISQLLDDLMKYDLAPAELQMIVNLRPHNPAVLMPIVEECDDRFDGDDVANIIARVTDALPQGPDLFEADEDEGAEDVPEDYAADVDAVPAERGDDTRGEAQNDESGPEDGDILMYEERQGPRDAEDDED